MPEQRKRFDSRFRGERNSRMRADAVDGRSAKWIAATYGVSLTTVYKALGGVTRGQGWGDRGAPAVWERSVLAGMPIVSTEGWLDALDDALDSREAVVYFVQMAGTRLVKIGTSRDRWTLKQRVAQLQNANPHTLILRRTVKGDANVEVMLHAAFADLRVQGEWFECDDRLAQIARARF